MNWDGLFVATHRDVYEPSDDTFLLARVVGDLVQPGECFIEVGCGTGLVSLVAARKGASAICTDRNPYAAAIAKANASENRLQLDVLIADLLSGLTVDADWVVFNPPYLPTAPDEHVEGPLDWAFDGGPDGNQVALRFADQVAELRPRNVLVIHSSLSDPRPLLDRMAVAGYDHEVAADERLPYERLFVRRFERKRGNNAH
ncbi:MAG: HemK2/MTQ2 family protein methyltransferase [Thermoplasmatota archaeon]